MEPDAKLVDEIARRVAGLLKTQGKPVAPASQAGQPRQVLRHGGEIAPQRRTPARVFVTEGMLRQRISTGGIVELADNEHLTPSAADLAHIKHITIRKASRPADPQAGEAPPGAIGIATYRADGKVQALLSTLKRDGIATVDFSRADCPVQNLLSLARAVESGQVRSGVAIYPYAADGMLLAGKVRGVRPVQGARQASVTAGRRRFGANLLILEHSLSTFHQMRLMIRAFIETPGSEPIAESVLAAVAELER